MKSFSKLGLTLLSLVALSSGVGTSVNASLIHHTHHVRTYKLISMKKHSTHKYNKHVASNKKLSKSQLKNAVYIMTLQLGASHESMMRLNHILAHSNYEKANHLYETTNRAYYKVNHYNFNLIPFEYNK